MRIYIAGKMRGRYEFNRRAFDHAAAELRAAGHEVFSPAEHDLDCGYDFTGCEGTQAELDAAGFDFRKMLADDLAWICQHAEALVVLDGWETSTGTTAEIGVARALGIQVLTLRNTLAMTMAG